MAIEKGSITTGDGSFFADASDLINLQFILSDATGYD